MLVVQLCACPLALGGDEGDDEILSQAVEIEGPVRDDAATLGLHVEYFFEADGVNERALARLPPLVPGGLATAHPGGELPKRTTWTDTRKGELRLPVSVRRLWVEFVPEHADTTKTSPPRFGAVMLGPLKPQEAPLKVRLNRPRSIEGVLEVRGSPDAEPLEVVATPVRKHYLRVLPTYLGSAHAWARASADGRFRLDGLGPYRYVIEVLVGDGLAAPKPRLVDLTDCDSRWTMEEPIRIPGAVKASVRVVNARNVPQEAAHLLVYEDAPDGTPRYVIEDKSPLAPWQTTDAEGRLRLSSLRPGAQYTVVVRPPRTKQRLARNRPVIRKWVVADGSTLLVRLSEPGHDAGK